MGLVTSGVQHKTMGKEALKSLRCWETSILEYHLASSVALGPRVCARSIGHLRRGSELSHSTRVAAAAAPEERLPDELIRPSASR